MDGVQLQRGVQDENAGAGPSLINKQSSQQSSSLKAGPLSARKAFGNITNKGTDAGSTATAMKRRALGELSVNRLAAQPLAEQSGVKASKPPGQPVLRQPLGQLSSAQPAAASAGPAPAAAAAAIEEQQQQDDLARRYAAGGVECFAGKTWEELEDEREAEEEARAAASARRMVAQLCTWRISTLQIPSDDEDELLAPQVKLPQQTKQQRQQQHQQEWQPVSCSSPLTYSPTNPSLDHLAGDTGADIAGDAGADHCLADLLPDLPPPCTLNETASGDGACEAAPVEASGERCSSIGGKSSSLDTGGCQVMTPDRGGQATWWSAAGREVEADARISDKQPCSPDVQPW